MKNIIVWIVSLGLLFMIFTSGCEANQANPENNVSTAKTESNISVYTEKPIDVSMPTSTKITPIVNTPKLSETPEHYDDYVSENNWEGWILFVSDHEGYRELYLLSPETLETIKLGVGALEPSHPAWSHNYQKIAFLGKLGNKEVVYLLDLRCLLVENSCHDSVYSLSILGLNVQNGKIAWHPNNHQIAFQFWRGDILIRTGIAIIDIDTNDFQILIEDNAINPTFSQNGEILLYTSLLPLTDEPTDGNIFSLEISSKNQHLLLSPEIILRDSFKADWSLNDDIVFVSSTGDLFIGDWATKLYITDSTGSTLTDLMTYGDSPSWSPSGEKIIYMTREGLILLDINNFSSQLLFSIQGKIQNFQAAWSP